MRKLLSISAILFSVAIYTYSYSQYTTVQNGNIGDCATWGNPTQINNSTSDILNIANNNTVTVNENWSAGQVIPLTSSSVIVLS